MKLNKNQSKHTKVENNSVVLAYIACGSSPSAVFKSQEIQFINEKNYEPW